MRGVHETGGEQGRKKSNYGGLPPSHKINASVHAVNHVDIYNDGLNKGVQVFQRLSVAQP